MDVDAPVQAPNPEEVEQLSELLVQLEETPENVQLLNKAAELMGSLGLATEQLDILDRLSELVMLTAGRSDVNES